MCLLAVLGSQSIVVKCTAAIFFRTVDSSGGHFRFKHPSDPSYKRYLPPVPSPVMINPYTKGTTITAVMSFTWDFPRCAVFVPSGPVSLPWVPEGFSFFAQTYLCHVGHGFSKKV